MLCVLYFSLKHLICEQHFLDNFCQFCCALNKAEREHSLDLNPAFCRAALTPSAPLALMPPPPSGAHQPVTVSRLQMQLHLQGLQQNTNALRKQLSQLRNMQVSVHIVVDRWIDR